MVQQQQDLQRDSVQQQDIIQQQGIVQQQDYVQQPHSAQGRDSQQSCISYRQQRRISQGQRQNGRKTRGQTRAIKWKNEREHRLGIKPPCTITSDMKRIVGDGRTWDLTINKDS